MADFNENFTWFEPIQALLWSAPFDQVPPTTCKNWRPLTHPSCCWQQPLYLDNPYENSSYATCGGDEKQRLDAHARVQDTLIFFLAMGRWNFVHVGSNAYWENAGYLYNARGPVCAIIVWCNIMKWYNHSSSRRTLYSGECYHLRHIAILEV